MKRIIRRKFLTGRLVDEDGEIAKYDIEFKYKVSTTPFDERLTGNDRLLVEVNPEKCSTHDHFLIPLLEENEEGELKSVLRIGRITDYPTKYSSIWLIKYFIPSSCEITSTSIFTIGYHILGVILTLIGNIISIILLL